MNVNDGANDSTDPKPDDRWPIPLQPSHEVTLPMADAPPRNDERKEIHHRRPLPEVPDERQDE